MATFMDDSCSIFNEKAANMFTEVRIIGKCISEDYEDEEQQVKEPKNKDRFPDSKAGLSCLVCEVAVFDSVLSQRNHFKLDWHRFNVKQTLMNKPTVSEEDFEETISGELSSISGSDTSESESEDDDDDFKMEGTIAPNIQEANGDNKEENVKHGRNHPKIFLANNNGCVFSIYRAAVYSPKDIPEKEVDLINRLQRLTEESWWMVVMTAGGHFAAAIFNGNSVVVHKTFHRYTVRAKRGTAQGMRDSQQGRQPKSAGASLRRYNEAALVQEVHDLLEAWAEDLKKCQKVFIRVQAYNKPMLFGGKKSPLDKNDPRIRTIPFATRRPTFKELKRVQEELSKVQIIGQESEVINEVLNQLTQSPKKGQTKLPQTNPQKTNILSEITSIDKEVDQTTVKNDNNEQLQGGERNTSTRNKKSKKKKNNCRIADSRGLEKISAVIAGPAGDVVLPDHHLWNRLYCAVVSGNVKVITELLPDDEQKHGKDERTFDKVLLVSKEETKQNDLQQVDQQCEETDSTTNKNDALHIIEHSEDLAGSATNACKIISECWGEDKSTLLHAASKSTPTKIIYVLLAHGADPGIRDDRGRTPYDNAKTKEARDEFRGFMADFPDAFDYSKSHIPSPLTQEMKEEKERKELEKKKAQRKARKQRAKDQKVSEQKKLEEEMERKKTETITEREKRAHAAEKRFAKQQARFGGSPGSCALCTQDLSGRVPFERLDFKYCSTKCVREHRLALENTNR